MSMKKPLVGISLLAYNYGRYIDEAIGSLKAQTFQDFEVILIDDGSDDEFTPKKLRDIDYDKITKRYLYSENKGNAVRRREQYRKMTNKYSMDMSADDILKPDYLEKCVNYLERHPNVGAVSTNMLQYMETFSGEPFCEYKYDAKKMKLPDMLAECHFCGSALTRTEALKSANIEGDFDRYIDWDKWISIIEAGWKLGVINEPLFCYRIHADSLSHSATPEVEVDVFKAIIKKHNRLYSKYAPEVEAKLFYQLFSVVRSNDYAMKELVRLREQVNNANRSRRFFVRLVECFKGEKNERQ